MRGISLRKHKTYSDEKKVFILNFNKSTKTLLNRANIFTKNLIVPVLINFLKQEIENLSEIKINWLDNLYWAEQSDEKCAAYKFALKFKGKYQLLKEFELAEDYWKNIKNNQNNKLNPELEDSYSSIYAMSFIAYDDVKEIIYDMNKMFDNLNSYDD
jgi:hypothetical protein